MSRTNSRRARHKTGEYGDDLQEAARAAPVRPFKVATGGVQSAGAAARGDGAAAKPLLQQAANECPHNYIEYSAAEGELKRQP